ncbi:MAG: CBS domain-containing protein [Myxococcales bacterium]|nr:CBS domain-containing protein [Myxococcales bacterium]
MLVADICTEHVVTCTRETPILAIAAKMRDHHVGAVVVVGHAEGRTVPVGVITDRDVVVEAVVPALERIAELKAGDLLTREVVTVDASADVDRALEIMSEAEFLALMERAGTGAQTGAQTGDGA